MTSMMSAVRPVVWWSAMVTLVLLVCCGWVLTPVSGSVNSSSSSCPFQPSSAVVVSGGDDNGDFTNVGSSNSIRISPPFTIPTADLSLTFTAVTLAFNDVYTSPGTYHIRPALYTVSGTSYSLQASGPLVTIIKGGANDNTATYNGQDYFTLDQPVTPQGGGVQYVVVFAIDMDGVAYFVSGGATLALGPSYNFPSGGYAGPGYTLPNGFTSTTTSYQPVGGVVLCNTSDPNARPSTPTPTSSVLGPVFTGFLGQVYQFHGVPWAIHNLLTSASLQLNANFTLIAQGQSMTEG
jgi:hypothetical protein